LKVLTNRIVHVVHWTKPVDLSSILTFVHSNRCPNTEPIHLVNKMCGGIVDWIVAPGSAHGRPSARPPNQHEQKFSSAHVCRVTFKHLTQPLRTHIQSFGTLTILNAKWWLSLDLCIFPVAELGTACSINDYLINFLITGYQLIWIACKTCC
jgi:hypothetical protein